MNPFTFLLSLIVTAGLVSCLTSCRNNNNSNKSSTQLPEKKINPENDTMFRELRNMAFNIPLDQLQISETLEEKKPYGIIMDWHLGEGIATLVSYSTGDASLYLSTGGGVIGGGQHINVSKVAKGFVNMANDYIDKTVRSDSTTLPKEDLVAFCFLTKTGRFVAGESMKNIENNSSLWLPLFEEANKVITELRKISGKM